MALFRRSQPPAPMEPFTFEIDEVFAITLRGTVFTGVVRSGRLQRGQAAVLQLPTVERKVTIGKVERSKRKDVAESGETVGLYLDGIEDGDLPRILTSAGHPLDVHGLQGVLLRSA